MFLDIWRCGGEVEELVAKMMNHKDKEDEIVLPGFRFHPTDEELVGFYLRRKVENKPIRIEIIKHMDIYRYDPWDIPKVSNVGEKELYFFCMRGRKYRNSIRPNRVTSSGFWKATGIDKPIYSDCSACQECIGLKKSLVYYRGSAGKGTKTDWMMHEFRLPPNRKTSNIDAQEAEVWTLCRIFKRVAPYKRYTPDHQWMVKQPNTIPTQPYQTDSCSKTSSLDSEQTSDHNQHIASGLGDYVSQPKKPSSNQPVFNLMVPTAATCNNISGFWSNINGGDLFVDGRGWDELGSVVEGYTEQ